ncbi:MAG: TIGR03943 family protein [Candidatus Omnitrophica bacterium]|nr:TIGR03943 family protein [Candidatus Omnitrophota bacterium]
MKIFKNKEFYDFLICFLYFVSFLVLSLTGNYRIFVKKFYFPYILTGIVILSCLCFVTSKRIKIFKETDVYEIFSFVIFLFPLILVCLTRPSNLPTYAALKRGIQTELSISESILRSLQEKIETEGKYKKLTIKQILTFAKSKPEEINEKDIVVEGIVFKGEEKDKFTLIRFLVICCAADATPLGIEVKYEKKEELRNEEWVKVKGKVKIEQGKVLIYADEIEKISSPSDPYLY